MKPKTTEYLEKITQLALKTQDPVQIEQAHNLMTTANLLSQRIVLPQQLPPLQINEDYLVLANLLRNWRSYLSRKFGLWSLANHQTAQLLKDNFQLKRGLEIMSGNAMWSKAFSDVGVKMLVTDDLSWQKTSATGQQQFQTVFNADALTALQQYAAQVDFIIMSWAPNFGTADLELLQEYRKLPAKPLLLVVGEVYGATNSEQFWAQCQIKPLPSVIDASFQTFDFVNEKILRIE